MIANVSVGFDPARMQNNEPSIFVAWQEDGKQHYSFHQQVAPAYEEHDRLIARQSATVTIGTP